jgi:hypothetical protein
VAALAAVVLGVVVVPASAASAASATSVASVASAASAASAASGKRVCRVADKRLTELSGLAATASGYVVVNDGADEASHRKIFYLDARCAVVRAVAYPSRPRDTEDLGIAADGTLWVADIGDNNADRSTVGLWRLAPGAQRPALYRLSYPDGAHDAEALLLTAAGTPIVVTKSIGAGDVYVPAGALRAGKTTPLRRVGDVALPITDTNNPFSLAGHLVITGGAVSPDGRYAVLRTYADAFEFDVAGDDVVRAVTKGRPRQIALPDEPQGESVAYTADGTALLTVSEGGKPEILRYPLPSRPAVVPPSTSPATSPSAAAPRAATRTTAAARRAGEDLLPAGAVVTGLVLLLAAGLLIVVVAVRRRRR